MSHFAEVDEKGVVLRVIVADQAFVNMLGGEWVRCSYNTRGGIHVLGGTPLRKNYPGPGYVYDREKDAFRLPQPYPSWVLDEQTFLWSAPVPMPKDGRYHWDEKTLNWISDGV